MKFLIFLTLAVSSLSPSAFARLPAPSTIDAKLSAAHLETETDRWDQLNKDILYRGAATLDLAQLKKKYPQLAPEKLERLKRLTHRTAAPSTEDAP